MYQVLSEGSVLSSQRVYNKNKITSLCFMYIAPKKKIGQKFTIVNNLLILLPN